MIKMEKMFQKRNIFESTFDSFEFDDGFLKKVDAEVKTNKITKNEFGSLKKPNNVECVEKMKQHKTPEVKKTNFFDIPLSLDDFNESDFFDFDALKPGKGTGKEEKGKKELTKDCLSPIQGPLSSNRNRSFSSTPLKPCEQPKGEEKENKKGDSQRENESISKVSDHAYLEADLFEDWGEEINRESSQKDKTGITLSQAFKMIEEAEAKSDKREVLNQSIDLLTGEVVCPEVGNLFEESFDNLKSVEKKKKQNEDEEEECVIICEKPGKSKPQAAQKLNFGLEKIEEEKDMDKIDFSSDEDFDFFTRDLLASPKKLGGTPLKGCDSREASDISINLGKKRGKCFKIIESDTAEESPSPKFVRQNRKKKRRKDSDEIPKRQFIDLEAEVSDEVGVSSDETEEDGEYENSFVDEESYLTQNNSANMTAKYLESVKALPRPGSFKIPAPKPYNPANVFSQIPEETNTDYEIDSFCVNEVEEEAKTELSDLEIAEKILEMDRKKRKKKARKWM